jgi:hypothetical protein
LITDNLRNAVATYISGQLSSTEGKLGSGGNSTSPAATALDVPLTTSTLTLSSATSNVNMIEVKLSLPNAGSAIPGKIVREAGIFNGSDLWIRESFDALGPFASNETLEIIFFIEVE